MIRYKNQKPTIDEYIFLRNSADWNLEEKGISDERAIASLDSSPYCVTAWDDSNIIGMIRISGDRSMYGYIQDTIVLPEYQGKGVGNAMMDIILSHVKNKRGYLLGVCPSEASVRFYQRFGFVKRPENPNGFMSIEF